MLTEILIILALIVANGVFSAAEIATLSVRPTRLQEMVARGMKRAIAVKELRASPERLLATIQVGITLVSTAASAFGGAAVAERLAGVFRGLGLGAYAEGLALAAVVATISFLSLMLGELVPKSLALRYSEGYALLVSRPLQLLAHAGRPLVWGLTTATNLVLRLFDDSTSFTESKLSSSELRLLLEEAAKSGELRKDTGEIARRALDFEKLSVAEVMVLREDMVTLEVSASTEEVVRVLGESGHARIPVCEGGAESVVGYVTAREVLGQMATRQQVSLPEIVRAPYFIPGTMPAVEALKELQQRRMRLAIVVSDSGALLGMVTVEDLVEELVGDIFHEYEKPAAALALGADGSCEVPGSSRLHRLNRELDLDLPTQHGHTLAALVIHLAGGIPRKGDHLQLDGFLFEITDASPRKVLRVRVRKRR